MEPDSFSLMSEPIRPDRRSDRVESSLLVGYSRIVGLYAAMISICGLFLVMMRPAKGNISMPYATNAVEWTHFDGRSPCSPTDFVNTRIIPKMFQNFMLTNEFCVIESRRKLYTK